MNINARIHRLRQWMTAHDLSAFVIPTNDPHNSEYTADYWKCREWICGFSGSAGTAVVTLHGAALWTDSRYFLQAEEQLAETPFVLMRDGQADTPTMAEWLQKELGAGEKVGFNAELVAIGEYDVYAENTHFETRLTEDPFSEIWEDRPARPTGALEVVPLSVAGKPAKEKVATLVRKLESDFVGAPIIYAITDLSEIAWLLNLRGSDIAYNPLFESYAIVKDDVCRLYVDKCKLNDETADYLSSEGVSVHAYDAFSADIKKFCTLDGYACVTAATANMLVKENAQERVTLRPSYLALPKSIKNANEIAGFRRAMLLDGVAMVRFRRWLDERVSDGTIVDETECTISDRLTAFRTESPDFIGLSFATIAGYGAHGAIVHYEAEDETASALRPEGLLLLDSGAQYRCGTTDITRTIALGTLTDEERKVYTLVLKGHIALSRARFPEGTLGIQLDLAARYAMWQEGYDFGHGTGHGVGSYLCVHEGPQQIRKDLRAATQVPFQAGMTITNEPGIYLAGKFGVRIENVLLTIPDETTPFGHFLAFDPLTLCPIDTAPIACDMLDETERSWLNAYHSLVRERLFPFLSDETDRNWLLRATESI